MVAEKLSDRVLGRAPLPREEAMLARAA
jgi:hypothetical protein